MSGSEDQAMTVSAPISTTTAGTTTDTVTLGKNSLAQNFDMFLTLLTAQMKNQDPLSPLDNNQFTSQLVQMTGVEQQLATNDLLKQLVANTGASVASAVDLIGKQVRAQSAEAKLSNGQAQWTYHLDADTNNLKISVLDANGNVVDVVAPSDADSKAGDHTFSWNGKNLAGFTLPDGTYTLQITTTGSNGSNVSTGSIYVEGPVTGVQQSNGQAVLTINGTQTPLANVLSVTPIVSNTTTATGASSGSNTTTPANQTSAAAA
jgi:flagellar basal-body rod modification protein FlgD